MSRRNLNRNQKYPYVVTLNWPDAKDMSQCEEAYEWLVQNVGPGFCSVCGDYKTTFTARFKDERQALMFKLACQ